MRRPTKEGESPVNKDCTRTINLIPSSTGHEESGVNQRGPYLVRLNTLNDR